MSEPPRFPDPDTKTRELVAGAAVARARVESDIRELARELTPAELKDRALDAAERSIESIAARALRRLAQAPRYIADVAREKPVVAGAVGLGVAVIIWRVARRRH